MPRSGLIATRGVVKRLLGGFCGMLYQEKNFKWCNFVRSGAYFQKKFYLKKI